MEIANQFVMPITDPSAVGEVRRRAARLAESVGFDETAVGSISIAATELGNNLVKHTPAGGKVIVQVGAQVALEILCVNIGGGSDETGMWMQDGYSTTGTLGTGLGAVRRLAQKFDLHSDREHGTAVVARFEKSEPASHFDVGVVNLPKETEPVCGDSWCTVEDGALLSAIVADGLGHGVEAAEASDAAIRKFREDPFSEPARMLETLHGHIRGTRGAAISILQIDQRRGMARFAGLGNVAATIATGEKRRHLVPDNGTVGYELRKLRPTEVEWSLGDVAVMHSDGLSTSWNLNNYPAITRRTAATMAAVLYRDHFKKHDDVTVVVIKARAV
jgi:anti-sigma regulatory factor (Ser/Thr protein kinase)